MQALILAAGMGKRLKSLTKNNTKCMVEVNGVTLIERMLRQLEKKRLSRIVIVVGYEGQKLIDYIETLHIQTPVIYINNPIYDKTNNIYSLALAKEWLCKEDTILFESDLIFEDSILDSLIDDPRDTIALVDKYESWMDGTCVIVGDDDRIESFVPGKKFRFDEIKKYYKTVNIYKFSEHFSKTHYVPFLDAYQSALGQNEYYEQVLRVITMLDEPEIKAKRLEGQLWYEIDDIQDLDIAESIFNSDDNRKVELLQERNGGYWRYPKLIDFSNFTNPYYPPQKMKDEIMANFDSLLTEYPSGMKVKSLLAAKNYNVKQENILVGNGTEELTKALFGYLQERTGFVGTAVDNYLWLKDKNEAVDFTSYKDNYSYSVDDLICFCIENKINRLILINPDNGNYLSKTDLLRLIGWAKENDIKILIDETFADFADETDNSLLDQDILTSNCNLYVIKDIALSHGVPGLRLGMLASGDVESIELIKKSIPMWNINSFGEFFMQIEEKYKKDYDDSLKKIRLERSRLQKEVSAINGLKVIPSQTNFLVIELEREIKPKELLKKLLVKHDLFFRESIMKREEKNYMRFAVRSAEDNNKLISALRGELSHS